MKRWFSALNKKRLSLGVGVIAALTAGFAACTYQAYDITLSGRAIFSHGVPVRSQYVTYVVTIPGTDVSSCPYSYDTNKEPWNILYKPHKNPLRNDSLIFEVPMDQAGQYLLNFSLDQFFCQQEKPNSISSFENVQISAGIPDDIGNCQSFCVDKAGDDSSTAYQSCYNSCFATDQWIFADVTYTKWDLLVMERNSANNTIVQTTHLIFNRLGKSLQLEPSNQ